MTGDHFSISSFFPLLYLHSKRVLSYFSCFLGELFFENLPAHTSTCITHMLSRLALFPTHTHGHAVIRHCGQSGTDIRYDTTSTDTAIAQQSLWFESEAQYLLLRYSEFPAWRRFPGLCSFWAQILLFQFISVCFCSHRNYHLLLKNTQHDGFLWCVWKLYCLYNTAKLLYFSFLLHWSDISSFSAVPFCFCSSSKLDGGSELSKCWETTASSRNCIGAKWHSSLACVWTSTRLQCQG